MLALSLALGGALGSGAIQSASAQESPRVERIVFDGAEAFDGDALRRAIVTEETRCRGGFLLRPVCRITDWNVLLERHFLDVEELPLDELRLRAYYHLRGYREAEVASEVRPVQRGVEVVFQVAEGEPTVLASLEVEQEEEVLSGSRLRRAGLPEVGAPVNLVALDTALAHLAARLGERGYLDAMLHDSVEIDPATRSARVRVRVVPGGRATVGELVIEGNEQIEDRTIANGLRLEPGRVLRTSDIAASQRSLYESNLFHEARVAVPPQPGTQKRLEITVREAPQRGARIGGGFNTVEFLQTEGRLTHYNFLGRGRRLELRGVVGNLFAETLNGRGIFRNVLPDEIGLAEPDIFLQPTWLASVDFMQPAFRSSRQTLGVSAFTHRRIIPGVVVDEGVGGEFSITRRVDYGAPITAAYRYELSTVRAGDLYFCITHGICDLPTVEVLQERHTLSPARLSVFADRANNPIAPTEGYRARLDLEHASTFTNSDFRYNRVSGELSHYRPLDDRRTRIAAGRVRFGWVRPMESTGEGFGLEEELALLHPRKRFYSGGSRSVRGFWENQLGPRVLTIDPRELLPPEENGNGVGAGNGGGLEEVAYCTIAGIRAGTCDPAVAPMSAFTPRPLGGTSVLEGNVEYRFPAWFGFTGVVFLDGATVGESLRELWSGGTAALTPGIGARTATPVGPVRVDIGIRPRLVQDLPVFTETIAENGERELVRLDLPRRYDALAAEDDGFVRGILRRLTLHLSIGEAF